MTTQTVLRPSVGARYVLERAGEGGEGGEGEEEREGGRAEIVYRGFVHLPDADVPVEVWVGARGEEEEGRGAPLTPGGARVEAGAVPAGGPSAAELGRMAAALVKAAVRSATSGNRPPPRKIVRWRG